MAIGILSGQRHTYRHDLESLFYVSCRRPYPVRQHRSPWCTISRAVMSLVGLPVCHLFSPDNVIRIGTTWSPCSMYSYGSLLRTTARTTRLGSIGRTLSRSSAKSKSSKTPLGLFALCCGVMIKFWLHGHWHSLRTTSYVSARLGVPVLCIPMDRYCERQSRDVFGRPSSMSFASSCARSFAIAIHRNT
jgi:hypothetical protein